MTIAHFPSFLPAPYAANTKVGLVENRSLKKASRFRGERQEIGIGTQKRPGIAAGRFILRVAESGL